MHYRTFKGILPTTGKERMADTVKMKHHAIAIPTLTPADRILEAARQLDKAIKQLPKEGPMDELEAIELLREVLLGERKTPLPMNSVQERRIKERAQPVPIATVEQGPTYVETPAVPTDAPNYISGDEEEEDSYTIEEDTPLPGQGLRHSKRVLEQMKRNELEGLERIAALVATETAEMPGLPISENKYKRGLASANKHLQMNE